MAAIAGNNKHVICHEMSTMKPVVIGISISFGVVMIACVALIVLLCKSVTNRAAE
jgi:hypothetical protein